MYHLYESSGEYPKVVLLKRRDDQMWEHMQKNVIFELGRRSFYDPGAIALLHAWPFELWEASDGTTAFEMLRLRVLLEEFDKIREASKHREVARSWDHIADAMRMRGREIRYISMDVVRQKLSKRDVESPRLFGTSEDVELALENIDSLLESGIMPEVSAVDRLHTAIHGHMLYLCAMAELTPEHDSNVSSLFSLLRGTRAGNEKLDPIFRGLAKVLDGVGSLRNNRSLAHPCEEMLDLAEARLALNAGKTLLRYLDDRFA
jgi:Abortive infection C-terminus